MPILERPVNAFWKRSCRSQAEDLCLSILSQARATVFYEKWGVPDTLEGRFDCACLHMALLLRNLRGALAQAVFDAFFSYTELTLREIGVGDLSVGKQVKKCAKFFYGALKAYHTALENKCGLEDALVRNLYGGIPPNSLQELIHYIKDCDLLLKGQDIEKVSKIEWPTENKKEIKICHPSLSP
ncbi:MAG TPA: ubiquinol-cytochrome C chaperone family protein [Alphaproteobacteria bacterium]|nr:ubiquinol-cytochrome C chaperone family protein [Alphaproteobacteria bacterium]